MSKRRVRITAKQRDVIDIEKLALALLGLIREMEAGKKTLDSRDQPGREGDAA